jgi:hypothetical protein
MSLLQSLRFNQMTAYPWSLEKTVRNRSTSGIPYIGVWCHKLDRGAEKTWGDSQREAARREPVPSTVVLFLSGAAQPPSYGIFC